MFLPFFQVGIWMLDKVCLSWPWNPTFFKPWLKSWLLHLTRLTLPSSILSHTCGEWSMQHNCCLIFFPEYLKVAKIAILHVFGFVEDEWCFNFVALLKNKVWNRLNNHFHLVVSMYTHKFFTLHNFPYEDTYEMWSNVQSTNGQSWYA